MRERKLPDRGDHCRGLSFPPFRILSVAILLLVGLGLFASAFLVEQASASYCPPGSVQVPVGGGYMCRCPDGSWASYGVPCRQAAPQADPRCPPNTTYCHGFNFCCNNDGWYCSRYGCIQQGSIECGGYYCNPGSKCGSRRQCFPADVVDCGNGQWCQQGTNCWRMPKDYPDPKNAGTIRCVTPEQQAEMEQFYKGRKEAVRQAEREKLEAARRKEEERKEAARRKVEEQREAARRKEEERKEAIARAEEARRQAEVKRLQEQHAVARQKVSEQLKQALEKQRLLELQKAAQTKQQELQRAAPPRQFNFTECQLIELANGASSQRAKSNCNLKYLETRSGAPSPAPAPPPAAGTVSPEQLEELRRKAVSLQPERRRIALPQPPAIPKTYTQPEHTFVPPNNAAVRSLEIEREYNRTVINIYLNELAHLPSEVGAAVLAIARGGGLVHLESTIITKWAEKAGLLPPLDSRLPASYRIAAPWIPAPIEILIRPGIAE